MSIINGISRAALSSGPQEDVELVAKKRTNTNDRNSTNNGWNSGASGTRGGKPATGTGGGWKGWTHGIPQ
jgi:hypothetical protein